MANRTNPIWEMMLAGFLGAELIAFGDLAVNNEAAAIIKIQNLFPNSYYAGLIAFLLIGVIGAAVCWVFTPKTRMDAFARGFSVFALLNITPYQGPPGESQIPVSPPATNAQPNDSLSLKTAPLPREWVMLTAFRQNVPPPQQPYGNATIVSNEWISSCKPSTYPMTFLNNQIKICKVDHVLKPGQRVQLLEFFETGFRGYRYAKIQYQFDGQERTGWIWTGRRPYYWVAVAPDKPEEPLSLRYNALPGG